MVRIPNDDVIEDFDFEKLACSNEVTSDFEVGFGWCRRLLSITRSTRSSIDCGFVNPIAFAARRQAILTSRPD